MTEREFLRYAAQFLTCRYALLGGDVERPGAYDDCGDYCGMSDAAYEMKLILKEEKERRNA